MNLTSILLHRAIPAMWLCWVIYWFAASRDVKPNRWRESFGANALHGVPLALCILFFVGPRWMPLALSQRFGPPGVALPIAGTMLVAAGLLVAVWARMRLGRNWSSRVVVKEDHALVRSGPYRVVRHPIYSGMLLGFVGSAVALGEWHGVVAVFCGLVAFLVRIHAEEAQMRRLFPEYDDYRRHSWALIPAVF